MSAELIEIGTTFLAGIMVITLVGVTMFVIIDADADCCAICEKKAKTP